MKQLALVFAFLTLTTTVAAADELVATAPPPRTLALDGAVVLPVGDYARAASVGIGALGNLELPIGPGFVTVRGGVVFHAGTAVDAGLVLVPIYAGYRLPIGASGGYLAGELGITEIFATTHTQLGTMSASDAKLGLTVGGGWKRGALDIRGGLFAPDISNAVGLIASVGYDFARF